jgi:hypothetical protein
MQCRRIASAPVGFHYNLDIVINQKPQQPFN